jgi:hypothetical protein
MNWLPVTFSVLVSVLFWFSGVLFLFVSVCDCDGIGPHIGPHQFTFAALKQQTALSVN